jgi:ACS family hexuronate transporter-like MFS transporter
MTAVSHPPKPLAPLTPPAAPAAPSGVATWLLIGLLFFATLLNYLDRQTISVLATRIAEDPAMRLTDADLGKIFFAFLLAYGIAQLLIGPLLDRFSVKVLYPIAVSAWSLAGGLAALATGFASLFGLRMLLGVCESPNWPLALRVVARMVPPPLRSLASGVFQCGTSVGALVAPPLIVAITVATNWRLAFVVVGAIGLVWAAAWLIYFALFPAAAAQIERGGCGSRSEPEPGATRASSIHEIFRSRAFWGLFIATSFLNPLQYFYTTWLPRYFEKYAGVPFGAALASRLIIVYLALDLGLIAGGAAVALLANLWGLAAARRAVATLGALGMASIPLVAWLSDLDAVTAVICAATFGLGCCMVNYLACTAEVSSTRVSTAAGLLGGTGSLTGAAFMWLVGDLVTQSGSFGTAFVLAGLMPLVALAGLWVATKPVTD